MTRWGSATLALVVLIAAATSAAAIAQAWRLDVERGLRRTVRLAGAETPAVEATLTSRIDAEFLRADRWEPDQELVVRWRGFWSVPVAGRVELHATTNGRLELRIDGVVRLSRSRQQGPDQIPPTIALEPGLHAIELFARLPGDGELSLSYAAPDSTPVALGTARLFPRRYTPERIATAVRADQTRRATLVLWGLTALLPVSRRLAGHLGALSRLAASVSPRALGATTALAYLLLLFIWFRDPGIAGTSALRAWHAWPAALLLAASGFALAWRQRERLVALIQELTVALGLERREWALMVALVALAAAFQTPLLLWPLGAMDADSTVNALAALHIEHGRVAPAFYYGSLKTGTLSSHLAAAMMALTGPSTAALMEVSRLFFLGFVAGLFLLTRAGFGSGAGAAVTLWIALTPFPLALHSTYSEYPELLFFATSALLIAALALSGRLSDRAWWGVVGLLIGLGLWSHPLLAPAGVTIFAALALRPCGPRRGTVSAAGVGLALGAAPAFIGLGGQATELAEYLLMGGPDTPGFALDSLAAAVATFVTTGLPLLVWGRRYAAGPAIGHGMLLAGALCLVAYYGFRIGSLRRSGPAATVPGSGAATCTQIVALMLATYLTVHLALFFLSPFRSLVVPPRYLIPLYLAGPALAVGVLSHSLRGLSSPWRRGALVVAALGAAVPGVSNTIEWYVEIRATDAAMRSSIAAMRSSEIDHCSGDYWDAYRVSHASLEQIICAPEDVRRIPFYGRLLRQRQTAIHPPWVAEIGANESAAAWRARLELDGTAYRTLVTELFEVVVVPPTGAFER